MGQSKRIAFIFPGQGSQYVGMARDFCSEFSAARMIFEQANDILGRDLTKIIFEGPEAELTHTRNSQTGIFVASMAILAVLREQFPKLTPAVCAGLSLGEYTAVAASARMDFEACLPLVQYRGQFMNDACEASSGAMAVVTGMGSEKVEQIVAGLAMPQDLWAANFNCPGQVVLSGTPKGIEAGMAAAKEAGAKRVLPLPVHGAFHSGLMQEAQDRLAPHVMEAEMKDSAVELVMNVPGNFVNDLSEVRENLIQQVTSPVRWEQGIRAIDARGVDLYLEVGCGKALTGMNRRIKVEANNLNVDKVSDLDSLSAGL